MSNAKQWWGSHVPCAWRKLLLLWCLWLRKNKDNLCVPIGGTVAHQMNKTHARLRSQSIGHR